MCVYIYICVIMKLQYKIIAESQMCINPPQRTI